MDLVRTGHMPSTVRTYSSVQHRYYKFCATFKLTPLPATEINILRFIAYISNTVSFNSMQVYLSAIRALHTYNALPPPPITTPRISLALKSLSHSAPAVRQSLPITYAIMKGFHSQLTQSLYDQALWACMTSLFFGCRRAGELTPSVSQMSQGFQYPRVQDLQFVSGSTPAMVLRIARTKTQPKGFTLVLGCSADTICPYCAMLLYLHTRGIRDCGSHPVPLFVQPGGSPMCKEYLSDKQSRMLQALGLNSRAFTPHAYRAGGATQLSINGVHEYWVQKAGQWKSMCYRRYIRESVATQAGLSRMFIPDH